jgi:hypothetical protein
MNACFNKVLVINQVYTGRPLGQVPAFRVRSSFMFLPIPAVCIHGS